MYLPSQEPGNSRVTFCTPQWSMAMRSKYMHFKKREKLNRYYHFLDQSYRWLQTYVPTGNQLINNSILNRFYINIVSYKNSFVLFNSGNERCNWYFDAFFYYNFNAFTFLISMFFIFYIFFLRIITHITSRPPPSLLPPSLVSLIYSFSFFHPKLF